MMRSVQVFLDYSSTLVVSTVRVDFEDTPQERVKLKNLLEGNPRVTIGKVLTVTDESMGSD